MKQVYMDYAATTPVKKEVLDAMLPYFSEQYGNPSSLYAIGTKGKEAVAKARKQVADLIGAEPEEIFFTASGSEADNWALKEGAASRKESGNHMITTVIEHHAILHTCEKLEEDGYEVTYLGVGTDGRVDPEEFRKAITDKTILASVMFANNEVGSIQPIKELAAIAKEKGVLFHTDAVQALGNVPINVKEMDVDMMSFSAHKIYGPKGVGALYIRKGVEIPNFLHGGGQEGGHRAGTENVPGIVGFGMAAELAMKNLDDHCKMTASLRDYFIEQVQANIEDVEVNGSMEHRLPGNANLLFHYIEGEALLLFLDVKGVYASSGSACSSSTYAPSHVLTAIGLPLEKVYSSLRFSIGDFTSKEDIDYVVEQLKEIVSKLRSFSPYSRKCNEDSCNCRVKDTCKRKKN
ncbi:MAG: cysteine desulfurase NifS [Firmicutes bacterium]|nr:cysteine desulfurase NifS [Bacillota bacterium]